MGTPKPDLKYSKYMQDIVKRAQTTVSLSYSTTNTRPILPDVFITRLGSPDALNSGIIPIETVKSFTRNEIQTLLTEPSVLSGLSSKVLNTFNSTQISYFTSQQIQGFGININNFGVDKFQHFQAGQLQALTPPQLQTISTPISVSNKITNLTGITPSQFATLNATQIQPIDVGYLNLSQINVITPSQTNRLTSTQLTKVSNGNILYNLLNTTQKQNVDPRNAPITLNILKNYTASQIASLTPGQILSLTITRAPPVLVGTDSDTSFQIQSLTTSQIASFTPTQIPNFTGKQIAAFTPVSSSDTSPNQIRAFTASQLPFFNSSQMESFTPYQLTQFNTTQINQFNISQLQSLSHPKQISKLLLPELTNFVGGINPDFVPLFNSTYTSHYLPGYNSTQISRLNTSQPNITGGQIFSLKQSEVQKLTASQISGFNTTQIQTFQGQINFFTKDQVPFFNATQISAMNPTTQFPYFATPLNLSRFTYGNTTNSFGQIQAITSTQLPLLQIPSASVLNTTQIHAFNVTQIPFMNATTALTNIFTKY